MSFLLFGFGTPGSCSGFSKFRDFRCYKFHLNEATKPDSPNKVAVGEKEHAMKQNDVSISSTSTELSMVHLVLVYLVRASLEPFLGEEHFGEPSKKLHGHRSGCNNQLFLN